MKKKDLFPEVIAVRKRGKCGCPGEKWSSLILSGRQLKKRRVCNQHFRAGLCLKDNLPDE